jgi:flagellar biosynthesis protein FlhF
MQLKVIRAESMPAALRAVRAALGDEALILSSRKISGGIEVTAASEPPPDDPLPPPLEPLRVPPPARQASPMLAHGVPEKLAARIAEAGIARMLAFAALPLGPDHPPLLLAGPPGAGKTLTAAKLAARLRLVGELPMVITTDGSRAGAIEQLAAFTRLLDLDLLVAPHPATLARALARREHQPVIIDGAGLDVFDPADAETLRATASAANATIALVLPANLDAEEASAIAALHGRMGASFLIPTRLDQSRRLGAVITAAAQGLAVAGFGSGAGVADGFLDPDPEILEQRLARPPAHAGAHP